MSSTYANTVMMNSDGFAIKLGWTSNKDPKYIWCMSDGIYT
jgi:hypothetical protein